MKAIIIGGGIAGLTTAIALERVGVDYEVFEAAPELRETGAGILMAPNAMQVFRNLGIDGQVARAGCILEGGAITTQSGRAISKMELAKLVGDGPLKGLKTVAIHRGRLQSLLLDQLPPSKVHCGKRFAHCREEAEGVVAVFEDGTQASGDLLLAADGIHSAVRKQIFPQSEIRYSGQTCWRGIAEMDADGLGPSASQEMWGGALRIGFAPISATEVYWFAVALAGEGGKDQRDGLSRHLQAMYRGFAAPVAEILAATSDEKIIRGDISDLKPLPTWQKGRILLLGDAAHATTPNMGQGGCQAVEDGWSLSRILASNPEWKAAFAEFEADRREKVDNIVKNSWRMGKMAHWRFGKGLRNTLLRMTPASVMAKSMQRIYTLHN